MVTVLTASSVLLLSCGGPEKLDARNTQKVADYAVDIASFCALKLGVGDDKDFQGRDYADSFTTMFDAVDGLIAVYRENPEDVYQPRGKGKKRTMRQVLADQANDMESCDDEADKLDRVLRE